MTDQEFLLILGLYYRQQQMESVIHLLLLELVRVQTAIQILENLNIYLLELLNLQLSESLKTANGSRDRSQFD